MGRIAGSRLSKIHPYPGMIADELAVALGSRYFGPGSLVLDPFVGTGRTLAAVSQFGAFGVGVDVNPLAVIISRAKASSPSLRDLRRLYRLVHIASLRPSPHSAPFEFNRRVEWFATSTLRDLATLVGILNSCKLARESWFIIAAALSATVRDVSFCRKDQWKMHRLGESARSHHCVLVFPVFLRRIRSLISNLEATPDATGGFVSFRGDSRDLQSCLPKRFSTRKFDGIFTSPPYGDSRTTVQYGGVSELCLEVVSKIDALKDLCFDFRGIDGKCLGGRLKARLDPDSKFDFNCFWGGDFKSPNGRRVGVFLCDFHDVLVSANSVLCSSATAVFVVSRRTVNGHVLYLDEWLVSEMSSFGFSLIEAEKRPIFRKKTPNFVRPNAKSIYEAEGLVATMQEEQILVFKR